MASSKDYLVFILEQSCNPGPWGNHSRTAAHCAEKIAKYSGMDSEKAYVLGLLHDIGRKFGKRHLPVCWDEQRGVNNSLTCIFSTTTPKGVVMEKM
jgi:HD superfamily phosphohydrolase YqeK